MNIFGKTHILYVRRTAVQHIAIWNGRIIHSDTLIEGEISEESLQAALKDIKKQLGKSVKILVADSLSYVMVENIHVTKKDFQTKLREVVRASIPEDFDDLYWHHTLLNQTEDLSQVQITGFVNNPVSLLVKALQKTKITIEAFVPVSTAIAWQLDTSDPLTFIYKDDVHQIVFASNKGVWDTDPLHEPTKAAVNTFLKKIHSAHQIKPKALYLVGDHAIPELPNLTKISINPVLSLANAQKKSSIYTRNKEQSQDNSEKSTKTVNQKNRLFVLIAILILLGITLISLLLQRGWIGTSNNQEQDTNNTEATVSQTPPTPEAAATEEPFVIPNYSVQVLNGNGIAGSAETVELILLEEGFRIDDVDNAESFDFNTSVVQAKESVPDQVFDVIERSLNSEYQLEFEKDILTEDSEYDLIITVGTPKDG